ncbi:hypothetical protein [Nonomuraea sp. NPDC049607]|uniref:hypothetical protein n=1 Tax=unclassified Nonomuraea TaxID=2593643 RepID=UPI00341F8EEE
MPASESGVVRSRSVMWLVDKLDQVLVLDGPTIMTSVEDEQGEQGSVEPGPVEWALDLAP